MLHSLLNVHSSASASSPSSGQAAAASASASAAAASPVVTSGIGSMSLSSVYMSAVNAQAEVRLGQ
jgi:hypothetical protein